MKLREQGDLHAFFCPGCEMEHSISLIIGEQNNRSWGWNGSLDKPTIHPSVFVNKGRVSPNVPMCHSIITNGMIHFMPDCSHSLAGKITHLPDFQ